MNINETVKNLLLTYKTKSQHFTTWAEVETVAKALDLENCNYEQMCVIRDTVVMMSSPLRKDNPELEDQIWNAMLSITAVIDHYKAKGYGVEAV